MVEVPGANKLEKKIRNYLKFKADQQLIMKKIKLDMFIMPFIVCASSLCSSLNMEIVKIYLSSKRNEISPRRFIKLWYHGGAAN